MLHYSWLKALPPETLSAIDGAVETFCVHSDCSPNDLKEITGACQFAVWMESARCRDRKDIEVLCYRTCAEWARGRAHQEQLDRGGRDQELDALSGELMVQRALVD